MSMNEAFKPRWWNFGNFPPSPQRITFVTMFSQMLSLLEQPALGSVPTSSMPELTAVSALRNLKCRKNMFVVFFSSVSGHFLVSQLWTLTKMLKEFKNYLENPRVSKPKESGC